MSKKKEIKKFYKKLLTDGYEAISNYEYYLDFFKRLVKSCENITGDELTNRLIREIAIITHEKMDKNE